MQLSFIICFAAASLAMASKSFSFYPHISLKSFSSHTYKSIKIAPVRQTKLAARAGAIQRRAALAQEATQPEPQPAPQPDGEEEDEVDTNELITAIAGQLGDLIFNDETGDDIETGLGALFEILNRA